MAINKKRLPLLRNILLYTWTVVEGSIRSLTFKLLYKYYFFTTLIGIYILSYMNNKFREFFERSKILTGEEFDQIVNVVSFVFNKNKATNNSRIVITLKNKVLPINIYTKIVNAIKNFCHDSFEIELKGETEFFSEKEVKDYFVYFVNKLSLDKSETKNLLNITDIKIENGNLIFSYFHDFEEKILNELQTYFILSFKAAGFKINSLKFAFSKDKQSLELYNMQKMNEINQSFKNIRSINETNAQILRNNKINTKKIIQINEVDNNVNYGVLQCQIFKTDKTKTKNGSTIYTFWVTDFKNAIKIKCFATDTHLNINKSWNNLPSSYLDEFHVNDWINVECSFNIDKYNSNELTGLVRKIIKIKTPKEFIREDDAKNKRVELLVHTKMSAFDGICSTQEVIERSKQFGWNAISIIDRFNVQSFPDAYNIAKKLGQKVIYGVELNVLNESAVHVLNPRDEDLVKSEMVVFDIETSGLNNEFNDLIEFGAIKIKDLKIVDRIDFFIKPIKPISSYISSKTHITNEILEQQGIDLITGLNKIKEWIGNATLIAHNGINFDYRFLNKKLQQNNLPLITNPIIDTMQLSRYINNKAVQHNLGAVSHLYHLEYNDDIAHRADFDAEVLTKVWIRMVNFLESKNIKNLNQLNNLVNDNYYNRQFADNYLDVYCKNNQSFKKLYKLISNSNTEHLYTYPRVFYNELNAIRDNFIIANAPTESILFDTAINGTEQELIDAINYLDFVFVASPNNLLHKINGHDFTLEQIQSIIKKIINTANKLNKKVIAVSDAYYLDEQDQIGRRVYINSKLLGGKAHRLYRYGEDNSIIPDNHLRTTKEMLDEFSFLKDKELINQIVITNSVEFAKQIENNLEPIKLKLYPPKIENVEEKLLNFAKQKLAEIYGDKPDELIQKRVKKELDSILINKFSIIYWIAHLLVEKSLSDGFIVGSRGSVGSSFLAYLLNITEVNPLPAHYRCPKCHYTDFNVDLPDGFDLVEKTCPHCGAKLIGDGHNIPFETFLGFRGEKTPDIDLNFSGLYQSTAHEFIRDLFGHEHTYRAGTIATVADKTAFGYVKAYFERTQPDQVVSSAYIDWISSKCVDVKRTTGQHPGGIIIVPKDMSVFDFTPYQYSADDKSLTWYTTHFTFTSLHDNLLKLDILGHDDPTKLKLLEQMTGIKPRSIPFHDEKVLSMFTTNEQLGIKSEDILGETTGAIGLPEFGTEFVRTILKETKPKSFDDLISISGLSHGTNVWLGNARELINKTHLTLSEVVTCRDGIMTNLMKLGVPSETAFSVMETVRKGKGIKDKDLQVINECKVPKWYIDSCLKISYLFPKAHATAYVISAWRVAWFKMYYPAAFYASLYSIKPDAFDLETALKGSESVKEKLLILRKKANNKALKNELKPKEIEAIPIYEVMLEMFARGIKFKNVSLSKSKATDFQIENNCIIPPFNVIPGLGNTTAKTIVIAREQKPFNSKEDLLKRTSINSTVFETMNNLGIIDELCESDQMSIFDF